MSDQISTTTLESYINELFVDHVTVFPHQPSVILARLWEVYESKQTLEKFELALLLLEKEKFDRGSLLYQNIISLTKLPNALVHC